MKLKLFLPAILLIAGLASCKKDDSEVITNTVNVPAKQIETGGINQTFFLNGPYTITASGSGAYEYGTKFAVTQNGKALRLGCKMPASGAYRVTLWDMATSTAIGQATVTQAQNQTMTFASITPVDLTTGKDYLVSIYSTGAWNEVRVTGGGNIPYPITIGSIILKGYQWRSAPSASPAVMPTTAETSYNAGLADIEFQAN